MQCKIYNRQCDPHNAVPKREYPNATIDSTFNKDKVTTFNKDKVTTFNKDKVTTFNKDKVTPFSDYKVAPLSIKGTTLIHLKVILFNDTSSANTTLKFKVTALNIRDISKIQQRTNMILQIIQRN